MAFVDESVIIQGRYLVDRDGNELCRPVIHHSCGFITLGTNFAFCSLDPRSSSPPALSASAEFASVSFPTFSPAADEADEADAAAADGDDDDAEAASPLLAAGLEDGCDGGNWLLLLLCIRFQCSFILSFRRNCFPHSVHWNSLTSEWLKKK